MTKWTAAQRKKFIATMKRKKMDKAIKGEQEIPLEAIPDRPAKKGAPKHVNGAMQMHAEFDTRTGELSLLIGSLRVPLRLRQR